MNHDETRFSNPDDRLDAMLKKRVVRPSADFTAATIARLRTNGDVSDELIDKMLAGHPIAPKADFTARTMHRVSHRNNIVSFFRPAMAAAASVAISVSGIWVYETASYGETEPQTVVSASAGDMDEIKELAAALRDAAPLLDPSAMDTLAMVSGE